MSCTTRGSLEPGVEGGTNEDRFTFVSKHEGRCMRLPRLVTGRKFRMASGRESTDAAWVSSRALPETSDVILRASRAASAGFSGETSLAACATITSRSADPRFATASQS